ncbi:type II toxin-antitoxin system VapC family toxin [Gilvimarinus sp. F26214L]|uniref:type II toxin-antitoxin system VapC family toxin n=1 Tax=Gilvimarinus sp. DZF01 TaxID=3461371 RepID=UPI0040452689
MYLFDTNIVSELRKSNRANAGVISFIDQAREKDIPSYISAVTIGELRRGVDLINYRGDYTQASLLEDWLSTLLEQYADHILDFGREEALVWGRLRVPYPENALDKQIAATALVYGLTLITRNIRDFAGTGIEIINPFS